ncbi:MAG: hypothetical protein HOC71_12530 [Candidatus Latescibacteria bacterium]|jgi:hypothetical protein|nr:hypothetical protein [Candidatus Latescibacterota bacterium]
MDQKKEYSINESKFDKSLDQLRDHLKKIQNQLIEVSHIDNVYWQLQAIIGENPEINYAGPFQNWITDTYSDSVAIRLRRLIDRKRHTVSLWRLLEDMKNIAINLTREWYQSMYDESFKILGNKCFNDLTEIGSTHVTKKRISSKQAFLKEAVSFIEAYANTKVAHISRVQNGVVPTFRDGREAIASIFYIFNWCSLLLTKGTLYTPVPLDHGNWLNVFKLPWLEKGKQSPQYRHLDAIIDELKDEFKMIEKNIDCYK